MSSNFPDINYETNKKLPSDINNKIIDYFDPSIVILQWNSDFMETKYYVSLIYDEQLFFISIYKLGNNHTLVIDKSIYITLLSEISKIRSVTF